MDFKTTTELHTQPYDCLLLVHPHIHVLERTAQEIQGLGVAHLDIGKDLSQSLMSVSMHERSRFTQNWLLDILSTPQNEPVLCIHPDLLFHPSLKIDPLALFRQASRIKRLIVLWPGEYLENNLSYAIPEHHHYRSWRITDAFLQQPSVKIHQLSFS